MNSAYTSFLICDHPQVVNVYRNGLPLATYDKKTEKIEVSPNITLEDVRAAEDTITAVLLMLKAKQAELKPTR